jgi:hypothetical protein
MLYLLVLLLVINFLLLVTQYIAIKKLKTQFLDLVSFLGQEEEKTIRKTIV